MSNIKNPPLYSVLFHFNTYTNKLNCFHRKDYRHYWNEKHKCNVGVGDDIKSAYEDLVKSFTEVKKKK
tara:strand:+ start:57 stop:260 length:204 start_codon:yes stop_codon:yes gene_type:complete